jgi:branched-chain amino acid transport system ATP-binding protein
VSATGEKLLSLEKISVHYGAIQALENVSFDLRKGEILSIIGSNGAGKSTTLRAISGLRKISSGQIVFRGNKISGLPAHEIVRQRVVQAPEGRGIFLNLTIEENLDLGAWSSPDKTKLHEDFDYVYSLFPRLKERTKQNAGTLSGGEQQMLAIARSLMARPEVLLLDEPSLGLAPQVIQKIFEIIVKINKEGKTILLVEQNAVQALEISHRGLVLETGKVTHQDEAKNLLKSDKIREAYLGG